MARRDNLSGLAALAALGYAMTRGNKAPVETLSPEPAATPVPVDYGEDYAREVARGERGQVGVGAMAPKSVRAAKDEAAPSKTTKQASQSGVNTRNLERGTTRVRPATGAPVQTMGARSLVSQIPGSAPEGWQGGTGERVDSTELGRNFSNAMNALAGPSVVLPTISRAGKVATSASRALSSAETPVTFLGRSGRRAMGQAESLAGQNAPRLTYEEAQALASGKAAPRLSGPAPRLSAPEAERALSEADWTGGAIGYKKGGSTRKTATAKKTYAKGGTVKAESKPAAKGWGKARGVRAAKIY